MKVTFEYTKTEDGHKLVSHSFDVPKLSNGVIDVEEYANCFKAIVAHIEGNHLTDPMHEG